jgi:putative transposase
MARRLRVQFEGAMYHVINRGNYRHDVFDSVGAAQAFEKVLAETCERYRWRIFAYVVMRNHFHLAVGTPQANLVEGMHWLQGTFATRFNRFREERGHLFQGRYHALLIENAAALARVASYIHLNPVRAHIVTGDQVRGFRWCSLRRFVNESRPAWLVATDWLSTLGWQETTEGWRGYLKYLEDLSADPKEQENQEFGFMSRGWAIGTTGWKRAIAQEHAHLALSPGLTGAELREMKESRWTEELTTAMREAGKTADDVRRDMKGAVWKVTLARRMRHAGAPYRWIANALKMGTVGSVRTYLHRASN